GAACEDGKAAASADDNKCVLSHNKGAACEEGKAAASANDNNVISHNKGAACEGKPASGADDSDNKGIKCEGKPASADDDSDISDNEGTFPQKKLFSFGRPIPPYLQKHSEAVDINDGFETSGRAQERSAWGLGPVAAVSAKVEKKGKALAGEVKVVAGEAVTAVSGKVVRARAFWKRAFEVARKHDADFPAASKEKKAKGKKIHCFSYWLQVAEQNGLCRWLWPWQAGPRDTRAPRTYRFTKKYLLGTCDSLDQEE
ncbi:unnamed protein product, partial [Brassica oleracea]